jgi:hypothetical protein
MAHPVAELLAASYWLNAYGKTTRITREVVARDG